MSIKPTAPNPFPPTAAPAPQGTAPTPAPPPTPKLTFDVTGNTGDLFTWRVRNATFPLGEIAWNAPLACYCYFPSPALMLGSGWLREIVEFMDSETKARTTH